MIYVIWDDTTDPRTPRAFFDDRGSGPRVLRNGEPNPACTIPPEAEEISREDWKAWLGEPVKVEPIQP